jgi:hypothetical protein
VENVSQVTESLGSSCLGLDISGYFFPRVHLPWVREEGSFSHSALSCAAVSILCTI